MSLVTALNSSVKALEIVQQGIAVTSNNIANVDTPGYIKQSTDQVSLVTGGIGQGAEIRRIIANVDAQLLKSIQEQTSELGQANVFEEFYIEIQNLFGQPNADNSLSTKIDDFFNSFHNLSLNPQTTSLKVAALNDAIELADKISSIAQGLHELRLDADRRINSNVSTINSLLNQLYNSNAEISNFPDGTQGRLSVEQERELNLRKLSEYIDISSITDNNGIISVLTKSGTALVDSGGVYQLSHTAAPSVDSFINNNSLEAITAAKVQNDGSLSSVTTDLSSSGRPASITTNIQSGTLKGLLDLRNTEITKVIDQMDILADTLRDSINAIHNDGSSFPPPSTLTGTRAISSNTELGFSGSVRIAVLDSDGSPPSSPYGDEQDFRPLTLDLSSLDSGSGAGRPTVETIIDEINNFYGPPTTRATVGNLRDVSLAVYPDTNSIANQGTVKFDLELDNISTENASVVVESVSIQDAGAYVGLTAPALPTSAYVVNPGDRERTNVPFTVDFSGGPDLAEYTVRVRVTVTDDSGNVSTADIDYTISDSVTDIRNDRYHAANLTSVTGTSSFIAAPSSQRFATASLVDANGNPVASGQAGYLKITTPTGTNYGIAIDELDSTEVGLPSTPSSNVTSKGFSNYFELNDFFVTNNGTVAGSAVNMAVRSDIAANASLMATGSLSLSPQPESATSALYTYEFGSGSNEIPTRISELANQSISFAATSTLPATTTTFNRYTGDIIGFVATTAFNKSNNKDSEQLGLDGLKDLLQESSGVNTDEELARIVELENNYRASARIITVVQELLRVLSDSF